MSLDATSTQVAPRANAAVKIRFAAVTGRSAIVSATRPDGTALPFGATVTDEKNAEVGIVGQSGIVFARGIEEAGKLTVTWGTVRRSAVPSMSVCRPGPARKRRIR
nr:FimD/PapC C-terminal domain-containing protein [Cupriavidus sp. EM10]